MDNIEITLLSKEENWGEKKLEILKKYSDSVTKITDLAILTGANHYSLFYIGALKESLSCYYTKSSDGDGDIMVVTDDDEPFGDYRTANEYAIRPVLISSSIFNTVSPMAHDSNNEVKDEVSFGEYPQFAAEHDIQKELAKAYQREILSETKHEYTFYNKGSYNVPITYPEYQYNGKKYIRVRANSIELTNFKLLNGDNYRNGDYVWVEVAPIKWLIDNENKKLISKYGLLSGIRFGSFEKKYEGNFEETEMYEFLNTYFLRDILQSYTKEKVKTRKLVK